MANLGPNFLELACCLSDGSETVTRDRAGNIGVRTVDEQLEIHKRVWVDFSFYEIIFAEITRELLRGGVY